MKECPIIWLESIIGAGKTTLLEHLRTTLNIRPFDEPFEQNPYFDDSYEKPEHFAALAQLWFALKRAEIHELATAEALYGTQYDAVVIDRGLPGDEAFESVHYKRGNIQKREHELYKLFYKNVFNRPKASALLVYLDVFPEEAITRIKKRGREAEKKIDLDYLYEVRNEHYDLMLRIETGKHEWSGRTKILRVPWNCRNQDPEIIVEAILREFPSIRRRTPQMQIGRLENAPQA